MVDNVAVTPGTGATFATDDIGGVQYPRVKIAQGADGTGVDVSSAAPLNVTLANGTVPSHAVTNAGTFVTQENGAALTALQLIDDTVVSTGTALGTTKVGLTGASVTTAAPTYTTGQVNALSMDTSGNLRVTGAGGGTQYTEDAASAADPVGNMMMAVRRDTLSASEVSADSDNIAIKATSRGQAHVYAQIDSTQLSPLGQTTKSASTPVTIASDQGYAGNVGGITTLFPVTLSLDTSAYASGDVLADTQVLTSLFRISDGTGVLQSIQVIDQDDQKQAIDFYYLSANNSLGTENSAPSISDANAIELVGPFSVAAADYKDLGGVSVAKISNIGQPIIAASGTANGYIAAVCNSGTPTYTASGIKLRLGILRD